MKIKSNFLVVLLVSIIPFLGFSQGAKKQEKDTIPYEVRYKKLKELFIKRIDTESYKKEDKLFTAYVDKLNLTPADNEQFQEMEVLEWIKVNLKQTSFKTMEEAEKEWAAVEIAQEIELQENSAYHNYYFETLKATRKFDTYAILLEEVMEEYPEKFPKPKEYIHTMPKLPGQ